MRDLTEKSEDVAVKQTIYSRWTVSESHLLRKNKKSSQDLTLNLVDATSLSAIQLLFTKASAEKVSVEGWLSEKQGEKSEMCQNTRPGLNISGKICGDLVEIVGIVNTERFWSFSTFFKVCERQQLHCQCSKSKPRQKNPHFQLWIGLPQSPDIKLYRSSVGSS